MSRDIKFRAWDKEAKYMVQDPTSMGSIMRDHIRKSFDLNGKLIGENDVVMQYTGLKDKNGVEIYEGDIVEVDGHVAVIEWDADTCRFVISICAENLIWDFDNFWGKELEVIGNIHENPELMEVPT